MIELKNVTTGYDPKHPLLENFSYTFVDDKIYGILGQSGCGKTTLLRTIAGLVKPLSGEVWVNGKLVTGASSSEAYVVHQNYSCFDWLTCLDNILIAKKVVGKVTQNDVERAKKLLSAVELGDCERLYPKQLSGGMRQRLALARTMFVSPKVLLMDEPLSALDAVTREKMQNLIISYDRELPYNNILMVTHSKEEAEKVADEVIFLKKAVDNSGQA